VMRAWSGNTVTETIGASRGCSVALVTLGP
jgi:hypothetical protein